MTSAKCLASMIYSFVGFAIYAQRPLGASRERLGLMSFVARWGWEAVERVLILTPVMANL